MQSSENTGIMIQGITVSLESMNFTSSKKLKRKKIEAKEAAYALNPAGQIL